MGENRFGSSVEGQDILIPTIGGSKVNYAKGGGYGGYITLTDDQGRVVLKTGHGDSRTARSGSVDVSALNKDDAVGEDPNDFVDENVMAMLLQRELNAGKGSSPTIVPMPIPVGSGNTSPYQQFVTPAWGYSLNGVGY
jgi:hypothetical protein